MSRVASAATVVLTVALIVAVLVCTPAHSQSGEATDLNRRALELYRAGKADEAIPLAQRALEMREKALPTGHPDIAESLNNLAFFYHVQGRLAEAEPLHKRALEMREKALPASHPDIAQSLNNLGLLYQAQGRPAEAEPLYKRALEMREKALPAGHPDIAVSLDKLVLRGTFGAVHERVGARMNSRRLNQPPPICAEYQMPTAPAAATDSRAIDPGLRDGLHSATRCP
jgi:tetratricopeptide (TPR) repeat protein